MCSLDENNQREVRVQTNEKNLLRYGFANESHLYKMPSDMHRLSRIRFQANNSGQEIKTGNMKPEQIKKNKMTYVYDGALLFDK